MRLSEDERIKICRIIESFDSGAEIFLYGSRADPTKTGGDVDLLILSRKITFQDKLSILTELKFALGDQKIDLLVESPHRQIPNAFVDEIIESAIRIN